MKQAIDKIRLHVSSTKENRSALNNDTWIFEVEFPSEEVNKGNYLQSSTNPILSVNGNTGEIISFTQQSLKDQRAIYYTPHIFELFKRDIKNIYGFDINDLIKDFKDDIEIYTNGLKVEEYNGMIDILDYTGKDTIFGNALRACQKTYLERLEKSYNSAYSVMAEEDKKLDFKEAMDEFFDKDEEEIER